MHAVISVCQNIRIFFSLKKLLTQLFEAFVKGRNIESDLIKVSNKTIELFYLFSLTLINGLLNVR